MVLRQRSGFEDFNILNFSSILLNIAILKFLLFLLTINNELTIITGQRSFSSPADGLLEIIPETKNSFEPFHCEIWKLLF